MVASTPSAAVANSTATKNQPKKKKKPQKSPLQPKTPILKTKTKTKNKNKNKSDTDEKPKTIQHKKKKKPKNQEPQLEKKKKEEDVVIEFPTPSQQLSFFINQFESSNGVALSSLERDSLTETCIVESNTGAAGNAGGSLVDRVKVAFGSSWRKVLCEKNLEEGKVDPGSPALLIISLSAIRSLELFREMRPLTKDCHAAKLFSKHMKIEEQVSALKERVNIASGTPNRIKKLIEIEALNLSRLAVVVLDMQTDVKGYSLFTLPQVSDEFWELYRSYFHQPLLEGKLRLCLNGPIHSKSRHKKRKPDEN